MAAFVRVMDSRMGRAAAVGRGSATAGASVDCVWCLAERWLLCAVVAKNVGSGVDRVHETVDCGANAGRFGIVGQGAVSVGRASRSDD